MHRRFDGETGVSYSQREKISEDANPELMAKMANSPSLMKEVIGTVHSFGREMKENVKRLED